MSTLLENYVKEAADEAAKEAAKEATEKAIIEVSKDMLRKGMDLNSIIIYLQEKLDISELEAEELLRG